LYASKNLYFSKIQLCGILGFNNAQRKILIKQIDMKGEKNKMAKCFTMSVGFRIKNSRQNIIKTNKIKKQKK
jgi:hypothetical protein